MVSSEMGDLPQNTRSGSGPAHNLQSKACRNLSGTFSLLPVGRGAASTFVGWSRTLVNRQQRGRLLRDVRRPVF